MLSANELKQLADYHRKILRCIQHLPQCTAIPAIYLLMGIAPLEAIHDIRTLSLFRNIVGGDSKCPPVRYVKEMISHQLAVKGINSSSWTSHVRKLLTKYQLPQASALLESPPSKQVWRHMVKTAVHDKWTQQLREDAEKKSTLQYLNLSQCRTDKLHQVWRDLSSPLAIEQASIQALLLVQRYPLTTSAITGTRRCDVCPLCKEEPETLSHFLLHCTALQNHRFYHLLKILDTIRKYSLSVDPENVIRLILDNSHLPEQNPSFGDLCRGLVYRLHSRRSVLLGGDSGYRKVFRK